MFDTTEMDSAAEVAALDVAAMPTERLEACVSELAAHLAAATCRFLLMVGELDRRRAWAEWGMASCAHWLSWHCALGIGAAREHIRVARALQQLPLLTAEFAAGRLSYSKMRALTRIATPEMERELLHLAESSTAAQVERWVRGYRRADQLERGGDDAFEVRWFHDDDGSLVLKARLAPEDGALLLAALEAGRDLLGEPGSQPECAVTSGHPSGEGVSAGMLQEAVTLEPRPVSNVDALMYVVRAALTSAPVDMSGSDRYQVVLHADRDALFAGGDPMRGRCELRDGPAVPVETVWRLACDSMLRAMFHEAAGRPVNFGRNRRLVTAAQRRLLMERDGGCAFPGCTHRRFLHAHHVMHWLHGGATDLDNLVLLCSFHHRGVHEGGISVQRDGDGFVFRTGQGRLIQVAPRATLPPIPLDRLRAPLHRPPVVGPDTLGAGWTGDRLHLDEVVSGLRHRVRTVPPHRSRSAPLVAGKR